jgi:hypothetical protein
MFLGEKTESFLELALTLFFFVFSAILVCRFTRPIFFLKNKQNLKAHFFVRKVKQLLIGLIQREPVHFPLFALLNIFVQVALEHYFVGPFLEHHIGSGFSRFGAGQAWVSIVVVVELKLGTIFVGRAVVEKKCGKGRRKRLADAEMVRLARL